MGTTVGNFEKRAVRWSRKPASSAPGLGGPERTGTALPGVREAVARTERKRLSWSQGAHEQVGATSLAILARYGWTGLHGVRWPGADDGAISHIAIGPGGVVVVDEKNWDGSVTVQGGVLRHGGYRCTRDIDLLSSSCATVTSLLAPEHRRSVTGVLCVTTRDLPAEPTGGVHVVGRLHLASLLVDLPPRLSPLEVADITRELTARFLGVTPTLPLAPRIRTLLSPLVSEPSGYFVPRPVPGSPHAPAQAPTARVTPMPGAVPVVRVSTPGWPGDELVTPPVPPQTQVPVGASPAACWPGDEGPAAARTLPTEAEELGWLSASAPPETWMGAAHVPNNVIPLVRPTTPGWPGYPLTAPAATPGWPARPVGRGPDARW
jgi:hypothetical protein